MCRCNVPRVIWAVLSPVGKEQPAGVLPALKKMESGASLNLYYVILCIWTLSFFVSKKRKNKKTTKKIKCNSATLLCGLMSVVFCDDAALRHCLSVSGARHLIPIPQSVAWTHTTTSSWNIPPDSTHSLCYQRGVQRCERTHAFSKRLKKENLLSRTSANFLGYATKFEV